MTELFGKLAPGATLDQARNELRTVYASMQKDHPEAYPDNGGYRIDARMLRDQITSGARTVLLVLLAASGLVFIIACSNVANLILARTVRREGELSIRAALGASTGALRRMLLAESLLLCGAGAAIGVMIAQPLVTILARYASRFSVRALDLTVDSSMLWVGVALAVVAAVILAFVPRLPSANCLEWHEPRERQRPHHQQHQPPPAHLRRHANRRVFRAARGRKHVDHHADRIANDPDRCRYAHVLVVDVPALSNGKTPSASRRFLQGIDTSHRCATRRHRDGFRYDRSLARCRRRFGIGLQFSGDGHVHGKDDPRAQWRTISPGFFSALGVPILAGRDFNALDDAESRAGRDRQRRLSRSACFLVRIRSIGTSIGPIRCSSFFPALDSEKARVTSPHRIIGVAADVDDEHIVPVPTSTIYGTFADGGMFGGHLFIHTTGNPYSLVTPVTKIIRRDVRR